jgi:hypothetical protein
MSAMGQKQTLGLDRLMSALPPKADIGGVLGNVRFVPKATSAKSSIKFAASLNAIAPIPPR